MPDRRLVERSLDPAQKNRDPRDPIGWEAASITTMPLESPAPFVGFSRRGSVSAWSVVFALVAAQWACTGQIAGPDASESETTDPPPTTVVPPTVTPPVDPEEKEGFEHWNAQCMGCHGVFEGEAGISTGDTNGDFRLDAAGAVARHGDQLAAYINDSMPKGAASSCQGACAERTATYIRSRERAVESLECDPGDSLIYGVRELKLLSSSEYQRSLEDLLGVQAGLAPTVSNNDAALGGFVNMRGKGLNSATLEAYVTNAEGVAEWAIANGRPFTCTSPSACATRFVDEFLYEAFRGPVSAEQRQLFTALFEDYPSDGLRLALEAALTSPFFLYRIEAGVDLQTALERGYYRNEGGTDDGPTGGTLAETLTPADFPHGQGRLENGEWALFQNGGVELVFDTPFTDPSVLEVVARGSNHGDVWPELNVRINGNAIGMQTVDSPTPTTYRFTVTGHTGTPRVRLEFNNDSGVPPYGPGQDANLYFTSVGLVTQSATPPPPPPPPPSNAENVLEGVASDAFVLTPYEFASALSFMLTGSTPDSELLEAARGDRLTTEDQIRAQVERLIDSPRGREHVGEFVSQWFGLDKVKKASRPDVAEFTPAVKDAMVKEVQAHFAHVFYDEAVPFSEFFGGDYTFVNRTLAEFYGVPGNFNDQFAKTSVPGRGGPIASGAFMAANAHAERTAPILRAVHSRQAALCHYIDPPNSPIAGDDIDAQRAAAQERVVQREQAEGALSSRDFYFLYTDGIDACAGCHERIINPMFGMEDFDNVGRLRAAASGDAAVVERINGVEKRVSLAGTLFGVESVSDANSIEYTGAKDFSNKIAQTDVVKRCLVRRGFRFLTGLTFFERDVDIGNRETLTDEQRRAYSCSASRMTAALAQGDNPRAMFIQLATDSLVRLRR